MCALTHPRTRLPSGLYNTGVFGNIIPTATRQRAFALRVQHRMSHLNAVKRQANAMSANEMTVDQGPRGIYGNWFRSLRLRSQGVANALCVQCGEGRPRSSTCSELTRLCCLESDKANDVGGHVGEREEVGK